MAEIQDYLLEYGVTADRKCLYDDMEALRVLGIEVTGEKGGRNYYYKVTGKKFEIAELKLLVDAVQSSKFIMEKKSAELIKKITSMASDYEAAQLKRQVIVQGRIKTMNESIYYNVDEIHAAISRNRCIQMEYMYMDVKKKLVPNGKGIYDLSPWALIWDNENYYLVAYDNKAGFIKHFRVDGIKNIRMTNAKRQGKELFREFDVVAYGKKTFGMYGGKEVRVTIGFRDRLTSVIVDRFGKEISIYPTDRDGWYKTTVDVIMSDQFYGWLFGLGKEVELLDPKEVIKDYKARLSEYSKSISR